MLINVVKRKDFFMADQPREYYRRLVDMAMMAGEIMISAGAETHRVEDTILHMLSTSNFSNADAFVLRTGITITLSDPRYKTISITRRVYSGSANLSNVCDVNSISREFCSGLITIDQAEKKLEKIKKRKLYENSQILFSNVIAAAGFAYVFGGGFLEAFLACFVGLLLGLNSIYISRLIKKSFISDLLGAAIVAVSSVGFSFIMHNIFNISVGCQYIIAGSLMLLVPGTAFTGAIRDIVAGDYISGVARIAEVLIISASVALGVAFGLEITEWLNFDIDFDFALDGINSLGIHAFFAVIATFLAIIGFCVIFSCPKKYILICCFNSACCWAIYLLCIYFGSTSLWATFFSAVFVNVVSHILARTLKEPVTLFFITGALPLVPGYGIYKVAYDLFSGGNVGASLSSALMTAGFIALAVLVTDTMIEVIMRGVIYTKNKIKMSHRR